MKDNDPKATEQPRIENATQMTGADMVVAALREHGTSVVFGYPGGSVLPLFDALDPVASHGEEATDRERPPFSLIQPGHEQAGVHAAAGYAQASGQTAVVVGTSGPGATNMITGIYDMNMDSIPAVIITGQVNRALQGTNAFQECAIVEIAKPCTKACFAVRHAEELSEILHKAFALAETGRPGPVLIDIPRDVQEETGAYTNLETFRETIQAKDQKQAQTSAFETSGSTKIHMPAESAFDRVIDLIGQAERPVLILGGGAQNAAAEAKAFVWATDIPVVSTFKGLGIVPGDDPHALGMGGMHGTVEANNALHQADLIVCVGGRFDDRLTGPTSGFAPNAKIVHVNIDQSVIGKTIRADIGIVGDSREAMREITRRAKAKPVPTQQTAAWKEQIAAWRAEDCLAFEEDPATIKPQQIIRALSQKLAQEDAIITTDVGQHQMFTAQHYTFRNPHRLLSSGGAGTMGSGIPAAIGAQIAEPEKRVAFITGDGSIQMHIQELGTAAANDLPLKGIVLDNGYLGMVRQQQEVGFEKRYPQTKRHRPDLAMIAEGYGFASFKLDSPRDIDATMESFLACEGPALLICRVSEHENCYPMIEPGKSHNQMLRGPQLING